MTTDSTTSLPQATSLVEAQQVIADLLARQRVLEQRNAELIVARTGVDRNFSTATTLLELTGELAQVGGWQVDLRTMKLTWTRETFRISELDPPIEPDLEHGIELFAPAARPVITAAVQAAIDHGAPFDLELPIITAKGRHKLVRTQGYAIRENGQSVRLIGTFQDITAAKASAASLCTLEEIHVSVFDSLPNQIAVLDEDGVIVTVNRAWREFAACNGGRDREANPVEKNYFAVCQSAVLASAEDHASRALAGIRSVLSADNGSFDMEYPCDAPAQPRWFHLRVLPMLGGRRGVVVSHAEITAHKLADFGMRSARREIENRQCAMDQHAILAVTDLRGRITQVNDLFCSISGYTREELLGQDHRLINSGIHPPEFFRDLWATIRAGQVWHGEVCNRTKQGALYWVYTTAVPLRDEAGEPQAYMAIRTDITARKQFEQRLMVAKDRAENLNLELETRIAEANDLALKAERANEVKNAFVANMSHEIRTPMNGIMGMMEILLTTSLSAEQEDYVRTANLSAEALMTIISDILDFSKLEAHRLMLERIPFDLRDLTYQVAELFRAQLAGRPVEMLVSIAAEVPHLAMGDPGRIRQILSNLVGNAVKFTHTGHVHIAVTWSKHEFAIAVHDTGIGIPADHLDRLFTPFTQVDASYSRKYGGTGLGLVISRRFAELMAGTLTVVSVENRGSTFTLTLPLDLADAGISTPSGVIPAATEIALAGLRILVIDDDEMSSQIVCEILAEVGARAESCADGNRALERLIAASGSDPFAAAVVDLRLPGMGGMEVAQTLRRHATLAALPLLMLTGSGQPDEPAMMEQAGFNGYLVKPVRMQVFHAVLATTIARCRAGKPGIVTRYDVGAGTSVHKRAIAPIEADVLLVEDHEVNVKIASIALGKLGARVSIAENGRVAVAMVLKHRYDLVLMDCQMPEMDGYEATQAIRVHEYHTGTARVPIIAMTANVMPGSRERCLAAGMDDYLGKPFKIQQLEEKLRQWLDPTRFTAAAPRPSKAEEVIVPIPRGELPVIDFSALREIERSDPGMAPAIVKVFLAKLTQDVAIITTSLRTLDFTVLNRAAHKIKGSSGSIGALALQAAASDLEAAALVTDVERCQQLALILEQASHALMTSISSASLVDHLTLNTPTE